MPGLATKPSLASMTQRMPQTITKRNHSPIPCIPTTAALVALLPSPPSAPLSAGESASFDTDVIRSVLRQMHTVSPTPNTEYVAAHQNVETTVTNINPLHMVVHTILNPRARSAV